MTRFSTSLVLAVLLSLGNQGHGAIVYEQYMSPTYLMANAAFPTRSPSLASDGSWIKFRADSSQYGDILLEVPLISANTLGEHGIVSITIGAVPLETTEGNSWDNDLTIGITDGTRLIGFMRADQDNGSGILQEGPRDADSIIKALMTEQTMFSNAGMPTTFSADFGLTMHDSYVSGAIGTSFSTAISPGFISPTSEIGLVVWANHPVERYQINWIDAKVSNINPIPEPSTLAIWSILGIFGLWAARCRRSRAT